VLGAGMGLGGGRARHMALSLGRSVWSVWAVQIRIIQIGKLVYNETISPEKAANSGSRAKNSTPLRRPAPAGGRAIKRRRLAFLTRIIRAGSFGTTALQFPVARVR
jgi:hypothetical protein